MMFGLDLGSLLLVLVVVVLLLLLVDLLVAGGGMTGGMMGGMAGMMGTPWGWGALLLVAVAAVLIALTTR